MRLACHAEHGIVRSHQLAWRHGDSTAARHVTSIESLTDRDGNKLAYAYDPETGLVESMSGGFPAGIAAIRYEIHAGYDDAPDVQQVLISAAKRAA